MRKRAAGEEVEAGSVIAGAGNAFEHVVADGNWMPVSRKANLSVFSGVVVVAAKRLADSSHSDHHFLPFCYSINQLGERHLRVIVPVT